MQRKLSQFGSTFYITITLNVDGLPVHSSSSNSFWPILSILDQSIDKEPIIVGIYYGSSKPNDANDYLRPFVDECLHLEKHGLVVNGQHYNFRVSCIIADAPARSFLKSIKSFNSLYGCEKCEQEGTYLGRTVWLYTSDMRLRTDAGFSNQLYGDEHQQSKSILSELDVGLITQVPLDYMHLVCLGVVKKLIRCWLENGPKKCRMPASKIGEITEFSRRPRPINMFKYWKATEFRAFILYLGPVVLRGVLSKTLYAHFLLLHCAIYILCTANICKHDEWRQYAGDLLHCFVLYMSDLYSNEFLVYNVHNLLHLADDAYNFGHLDNFSAFPFENFMSKIKNMVRGHNMPLEQVAKRMGENCNSEKKNITKRKPIKEQNGQIRKIHYNDYVIGTSQRDSCFVTSNGDIVIVKSIVETDVSSYTLRCNCFVNKTDFYKEPIHSSKLGI
ncbi:uncharacterized protein LOC121739324 [Aricia agestis]|nr:uncharacterized protein LOC121739324 [Aricia agestis]